jgi:hypothetical protein
VPDRSPVRTPAIDREGAHAPDQPSQNRIAKKLLFRHEVDGAFHCHLEQDWIRVVQMVRHEKERRLRGHVLKPDDGELDEGSDRLEQSPPQHGPGPAT